MGTLVSGIKEIFATAKSTGTNVMLCGNDGTPDGHITMANLASVLGVQKVISLESTDNINNLSPNEQSVKYWFTGARPAGTWPSSIPSLSNAELFVFKQGGQSRWVQLLYDINEKKAFFRTRDTAGTLSDWHEFSFDIPSFYKDYSTLKSIAEAAGACYAYSPLRSADDFNNYTHTGFVLVYSVAINSGIQNAPDNIVYGYLEIKRISSDRIMQTYTKWGEKTYYAYRYFENTSWGIWKYS